MILLCEKSVDADSSDALSFVLIDKENRLYTFVRTFVGLPLSQFDAANPELQAFLADLSELGNNFEEALQIVDESVFHDQVTHMQARTFCQWVADNAVKLRELGYECQCSYHGATDMPVIIGKYVDQLFDVPEFGAAPFDFSGVAKLAEEANQAAEMFSTIPKEVLDAMGPKWRGGAWFNNHSS